MNQYFIFTLHTIFPAVLTKQMKLILLSVFIHTVLFESLYFLICIKDYISGCINFSFNCQSVSLLQAYLLLELSSSRLLAGTGGNRPFGIQWQPRGLRYLQENPIFFPRNANFVKNCQIEYLLLKKFLSKPLQSQLNIFNLRT